MIRFTEREKRLTMREASYWRKVFEQNLMIGTEIEIMFKDSDINVYNVRDMLECLKPGGNPGAFKSPVQEVKSDGSLINGAEIITPGRRVYGFLEQFAMYQSIYSNLSDSEPIISPRMGWHNHIVLQNYDGVRAQEKEIPRIIFDNMMLLIKKYYPALAFMSSTQIDSDAYTRYNQFCIHSNLKNYDYNYDLSDIINEFTDRYNCVNLNELSYNDLRDTITNFHVEFRFPDGTMSPIQMTSLNILFKAIILKAIELSKFGIFDETPDLSLYDFKNNGSSYSRTNNIEGCITHPSSETRKSGKLNDYLMGQIKDLSFELVDLLKPEIMSIDKIAVPFLEEMCTRPISVLFEELNTTDVREVNDYLEEKLDKLVEKEDSSILPLVEIIETRMVQNVSNVDDWFNKTSEFVTFKEPIENIIDKIRKERKLKFNNEMGFYFE